MTKSFSAIIFAATLFITGAGCSNPPNPPTPIPRTPPTTDTGTVTPTPPPQIPTPTPTPIPPSSNRMENPVAYTYLGITDDKKHFAFKIKILSAKPIRQVDIYSLCHDASGKIVDDSTYAWQNIVTSVQRPIEQGKTYEDTSFTGAGTATCETSVSLVHFVDGSKWSAQ